jgi:hypothetical protein
MVASCLKVVFTIGALFLLSACFPAKDIFFEPLAEGGKVMKARCKGHVGYPSYIDFEREGVFIEIGSVLEKEIMSVYLRIPPGVSVSFRSDEFIWSNGGENHFLRPKSIKTVTFARPYDKQTIPVDARQVLQGGVYDAYFVNFDVPIKELNNFSFLVPTLKINEKEVTLPPIKFTLSSGWYIYPINC